MRPLLLRKEDFFFFKKLSSLLFPWGGEGGGRGEKGEERSHRRDAGEGGPVRRAPTDPALRRNHSKDSKESFLEKRGAIAFSTKNRAGFQISNRASSIPEL